MLNFAQLHARLWCQHAQTAGSMIWMPNMALQDGPRNRVPSQTSCHGPYRGAFDSYRVIRELIEGPGQRGADPEMLDSKCTLHAAGHSLCRVALMRLHRDACGLVHHTEVVVQVQDPGSPVCRAGSRVAPRTRVDAYPLTLQQKGLCQKRMSEAHVRARCDLRKYGGPGTFRAAMQ